MPPSSSLSSSLSEGESRRISWKEVAKHNTTDDCWISISGKVYDVTSWVSAHPGGSDVLAIGAGHDCTQVFHTYHAKGVLRKLPEYYVGELSDHELVHFPPQSELYWEMKREIRKELSDRGIDSKNSVWSWLRYAFIFASILVSSFLQVYLSHMGVLLGVALSAYMGFFCALVGLVPMHDSSHFSITRSPRVWKMLGFTHDIFNGASALVWTYQHIFGHHPYTNIDGADPDIETQPVDARRIKRNQPWYYFYQYQHVYAPLLYGVLAWKTRLQDFDILFFSKKDGAIRVNPPTMDQMVLFWAGRVLFVSYRYILPFCFGLPIGHIVLYNIVADLVTSYWLALSFQANHVADEVEWPIPDADGSIKTDWAEHQMNTTQDYAHDSWLWTWSTGALNYQVTHHLVPGVNQVHYPVVAPVIRKVAQRHGVKYRYLPTFHAALSAHIGYLWSLGHDKPKAA